MTEAYTGNDMIIASNVNKIYANGCHALKNVSATIARGEVVGDHWSIGLG